MVSMSEQPEGTSWDPLQVLSMVNISLENIEEEDVSHKVLNTNFEVTLVVIYSCLGVTGLLSNVALIAVILGKKNVVYCCSCLYVLLYPE